MSIRKISHGIEVPDSATDFDGWKIIVNVRDPETGKLQRVKKSFLKQHGFARNAAVAWEAEQIAGRAKIERARATGLPPQAVAASETSRRTVRDLAEYYFQDESFTTVDPVTQHKVRKSIEGFLEWNDANGPTYADQWTATYAKARMQFIRENHQTGGRDFHNTYVRKIFQLDLEHPDGRSIAANPFPRPKSNRSKRRALALLKIPRAYTHEELVAIMEYSTPYQRLLWTILYNTAIRSSEFTSLRREQISFFDGGRSDGHVGIPRSITILKTKNGLPRRVHLNPEAQDAVTELLLLADDSGFVIRRDVVKNLKTPLLFYLNQVKRRAVQAYPHLHDGLLGRRPIPDDEPKTMWRTRMKQGVRTRVQVEAKGRVNTNVHTFRKTCVTRLILEGRSIPAIARIIGDNPKTLLDRYAGVLDEDLEQTICSLTPILERPRALRPATATHLRLRPSRHQGTAQGTRLKESAGIAGNRPAILKTKRRITS